MGMWHATRKPILLIGLSPEGITQHGGGQGDALRSHGCDKSMSLAGSCSLWEGSLRDSREWRHRVGVATRLPEYAPYDWLIERRKEYISEGIQWRDKVGEWGKNDKVVNTNKVGLRSVALDGEERYYTRLYNEFRECVAIEHSLTADRIRSIK